ANAPRISTFYELKKLRHIQISQFRRLRRRKCAIPNPINPPRAPRHAAGLVAFAGVVPVEDVDAAVGAHGQVDAAEVRVVGLEDVGFVFGDVAGAAALQSFDVDAAAV